MNIQQLFTAMAFASPLNKRGGCHHQRPQQASQNGNSMDGCASPMMNRIQAAQRADMLHQFASMLQMMMSGQSNGSNLQQMMSQQQNAAAFQQGYQQGAAYTQGLQAGMRAGMQQAHGQHDGHAHGYIDAGGPPARNVGGPDGWNGQDVGGPPARAISETGSLTAAQVGIG